MPVSIRHYLTIALLLCPLLVAGCLAQSSEARLLPAATEGLTRRTLELPTVVPSDQPTPTATRTLSEQAEPAPPTPTGTRPLLIRRPPGFTPTPVPVDTQPPPPPTQSCLCGPDNCSCQIQRVVLISVDGLRPDALAGANTPTLDSLRAAGAYSAQARAVVPSVTLINHASMVGGMSPAKHGISWNEHQPELGKVNGPTMFSVAQAAGLRSAMVVGKPKLEHLVLPGSVEAYQYAGFIDRQVVNQALAVIQAGPPDILFIHLPDVDTTGHATGWMSSGQLLAISATDSLIGELVAALEQGGYWSSTLLLLTADHGGTDTSHGSDSAQDTTIPWLAVGPGVPAGRLLTSQIVVYDTAATVLWALDLPIPEIWDGQPVTEILQ